ncbi:casein kinase I [Rhizophlyctis rosea]|nr:casein kinase I [Rhizophlyctis rosea]
MPKIVCDKWEIDGKIGAGSFGEVFGGADIQTQAPVAVKRELKSSGHNLEHEYKMYQALSGISGLPRIHHFGDDGSFKILVMDRLGPSLKQMLNASPSHTIPVRTVAYCAIQMLDRLCDIHRAGVVFRDVKPDQFCVGQFGEDMTRNPKIYVIDFGLAAFYREDGRHIRNASRRSKKPKHKTGTARYASVNVHKGSEHTRRDDLESLASLPWVGMRALTSTEGWRKIGECKSDTLTADLTSGMPAEFSIFLEYTRDLSFTEEPDYAYCKELFRKLWDDLRREGDESVIAWSEGETQYGARAELDSSSHAPTGQKPQSSAHATGQEAPSSQHHLTYQPDAWGSGEKPSEDQKKHPSDDIHTNGWGAPSPYEGWGGKVTDGWGEPNRWGERRDDAAQWPTEGTPRSRSQSRGASGGGTPPEWRRHDGVGGSPQGRDGGGLAGYTRRSDEIGRWDGDGRGWRGGDGSPGRANRGGGKSDGDGGGYGGRGWHRGGGGSRGDARGRGRGGQGGGEGYGRSSGEFYRRAGEAGHRWRNDRD